MEPSVQILLELLHGGVEGVPEGLAEELIENGPVEALHKTIGPGTGHLGSAVLDIIEFQEDLVGMDHGPATVFTAIVGEDVLHGDAL